MIIEIMGDLGSGKTLFMTFLGHLLYKKGYPIMANYHLGFPYKPIDFKQVQELTKCAILVDEMHVFMDSRRSLKKFNQEFSYFILQTRKRNIILIYTTQFHSSVDLRLRRIVDYIIMAEKQKDAQNNIWFKYIVFSGFSKVPKVLRIHEDRLKYLYKLYDTNQIIEPINL